MGFTLRSFHLSKGIRRGYRRMNPLTVSPAGNLIAEAMSRPGRPRFLGFHPSKSSWRFSGGLVRRPLEAPLGFNLPGLAIEGLVRAFAQTPLTRFANLAITRHARRRPRVSLNLRPASPANGAEAPCLEKQPS